MRVSSRTLTALLARGTGLCSTAAFARLVFGVCSLLPRPTGELSGVSQTEGVFRPTFYTPSVAVGALGVHAKPTVGRGSKAPWRITP
jgi:hypothetical protein